MLVIYLQILARAPCPRAPVRLSVCVSATFVYCMHISVLYPHGCGYCIHTAEDIVKLLSQPDSPISLIFEPRRRYQFQGEWAQKQGVGGTFFALFD